MFEQLTLSNSSEAAAVRALEAHAIRLFARERKPFSKADLHVVITALVHEERLMPSDDAGTGYYLAV